MAKTQSHPTLFLASPQAILDNIADSLTWCDSWSMCVAWAGASAGFANSWTVVSPHLDKLEYAIVGLAFHQTEPWMLWQFHVDGKLRTVMSASGTFHPKIYLFKKGSERRIIVGSANFTAAAFSVNTESAVRVDCADLSSFALGVESFVDRCLRESRLMTDEELATYEERYNANIATLERLADLGSDLASVDGAIPSEHDDSSDDQDLPAVLHLLTDYNDVLAAERMFAGHFEAVSQPAIAKAVSYPSGSDERAILWWPEAGLWSCFIETDDRSRYYNSFGSEDPATHKSLRIQCEINVPTEGVRSGMQGGFAIDANSQARWLIHRGRFGSGAKGVTKEAFEAYYKLPKVKIIQEGSEKEAYLVARLEDPQFAYKVADFIKLVIGFRDYVKNAGEKSAKDERQALASRSVHDSFGTNTPVPDPSRGDITMSTDPATSKSALLRICELIPLIEQPATPLFELVPMTKQPDSSYRMPWYQYGSTINQLLTLLNAADLVWPFEWQAWKPQAKQYVDKPQLLRQADLDTLRKLITTHVRQERFSEGHLAAQIESGHLLAVLQRLRELTMAMPDDQGGGSDEGDSSQTLVQELSAAAAANPMDPTHQFNLGVAYGEAGLLEHAIEAYRAALKIAPDYTEARYNLGATYLDAGELDLAAKQFEKITQQEPTFAAAWFMLGTALGVAGDHAAAATFTARGLELDPDSPKAWSNLGRANYLRENFADAVDAYQKSVELDPGNAISWDGLGRSLAEVDELDEAQAAFAKALDLQPDLADSFLAMGTLFAWRANPKLRVKIPLIETAGNLDLLSPEVLLRLALTQLYAQLDDDYQETLTELDGLAPAYAEIVRDVEAKSR